ncbi:uncharacterized protein LOC144005588 [Festucalex cinctus]
MAAGLLFVLLVHASMMDTGHFFPPAGSESTSEPKTVDLDDFPQDPSLGEVFHLLESLNSMLKQHTKDQPQGNANYYNDDPLRNDYHNANMSNDDFENDHHNATMSKEDFENDHHNANMSKEDFENDYHNCNNSKEDFENDYHNANMSEEDFENDYHNANMSKEDFENDYHNANMSEEDFGNDYHNANMSEDDFENDHQNATMSDDLQNDMSRGLQNVVFSHDQESGNMTKRHQNEDLPLSSYLNDKMDDAGSPDDVSVMNV